MKHLIDASALRSVLQRTGVIKQEGNPGLLPPLVFAASAVARSRALS